MANFSGNSRMTDQILDYYLKFGQNRDLEKFLRLRANTTRSSSDGSIPTAAGLQKEVEANSGTKSLENLSTLGKQIQEKEQSRKSAELLNVSGGSEQSKSGQQSDKDVGSGIKPPEPEHVVVKESRCEKKTGRNFNFNLESVIEIKLPTVAPPQPAVVVSQPQGMLDKIPASNPIIHEISTAGTQTMPEARSVEQQTEDPIRPILKSSGTSIGRKLEEANAMRDISPVSSVASNKQRLEWDSLGDIGYSSNDKFYFCGAGDLNETEKHCLQKYFAKKGLNFDEKVVVVKNIHTPRKGGNEHDQRSKEELKRKAKQKWQDVYQKYKEKYSNPSEVSLSLMNPDAQSTPKVTSIQSAPSKEIKSTQTSLVKILTKAVQAEQQQVDTSDKQIGTETLSSTVNKTVSGCEQIETVESFEFFSSPPSEHDDEELVRRSRARLIPSCSAGNSLKSSSENSSSQKQQLPSSLSGSGTGSSGSNSSSRTRESYNFEDELRLGITLYHTICESRSLPARVKQSLVDKIFRKMMKNDPKGRTKEQLLQDCLQMKRPSGEDVTGNGMEGRQTALSGVETIGDSCKSSSTGRSSEPVNEVIVEIVDEGDSEGKVASNSEDIAERLQELSVGSNQAHNVKRAPARRQSIASSQHTLPSNTNSSNHTAERLSQPIPLSAASSSGILAGDERIRKAMDDYLKPMTHSEIDYAKQQELKRSLPCTTDREKLGQRDTASAPSTGERIFELFRKEKQSQLLKINKKIEHLKTMKLLLLEDQKTVNEIRADSRTTYPLELKTKPLPRQPLGEKKDIYENIEKHTKSASSAPIYTSVHEPPPSEQSNNQPTEFTSGSRSESGWNSHYHMKKMIQNRSKLETPTSNESIATFIKCRKDKFIKNYERRRQQMFDDQHHIYTKPYSGRQSKLDHYSPLDENYNVHSIAKRKSHLPRSDAFISSDSMSIPVANTLTNTTTHQYDIKSSRSNSECLTLHARPAATQTTGSIMKTKPIFESKLKNSTSVQTQEPQKIGCNCACNCPCRNRQSSEPLLSGDPRTVKPPLHRTEIVDETQPKQHKQQQTKPSSIAYVITFQGDKKGGKGRTQSSEKEQVYHHRSRSSTDTSASANRSNDDAATDDTDLLPLKEQFRKNRPGTLQRMKERQICVNELNKLRAERNKQRKKLLLLTSDDSLKKCAARDRLPPPPLAQRRIFSSKAIRENTRRQVRNLPEVLRKKEVEKINNLKRKNLILRDKFNRNLQRKVLLGKVDLSNSVRVMQE